MLILWSLIFQNWGCSGWGTGTLDTFLWMISQIILRWFPRWFLRWFPRSTEMVYSWIQLADVSCHWADVLSLHWPRTLQACSSFYSTYTHLYSGESAGAASAMQVDWRWKLWSLKSHLWRAVIKPVWINCLQWPQVAILHWARISCIIILQL